VCDVLGRVGVILKRICVKYVGEIWWNCEDFNFVICVGELVEL